VNVVIVNFLRLKLVECVEKNCNRTTGRLFNIC